MAHIRMAQMCVIQKYAMKNPFEFGRELGMEELVDRETEVASVLNAIRDGRVKIDIRTPAAVVPQSIS
jgi:hypothetical protein